MQSKSSGEAASTLFKPRQVLLNSISNMKHTIENGSEPKAPISLTTQQRTLLLQSICQFLELNGFSKTLKSFRKELDFEKGSSKSCLLNLEEMCYQYLKMRDDTKVSDSAIKKQIVESANRKMENEGVDEKKIESKTENHSVDVKQKKKKSKKASESAEEIVEGNPEDLPFSVPSEPEKKAKGKKKHKNSSQEVKKDDLEVKVHETLAEETSTKLDDVSREEKKVKSKSMSMKEDAVETKEADKEKKSSKKRKKSSSEENDAGCVENAAFDDPKCRKTDNLDQSSGTFLPKTPNGSANGVSEKDEKESKKGKKWQHDGSTEPRTSANAFRRVKEEEVEFVDEKLQDNSYWAKEGADSGYGAKAQEVLGQVRGRDFRHEKTKKKRGSYRGGSIDLNSHSFKFNYDDDE